MAVETSEVVDMIRKGDKLGVMVYLRYGGDPNARNHMGWTLLHLACVEGQTDIVEVLLDAGASVNSCTTDMSTPLHRACTQGYKTVVELLLKKNAYINAQDKAGNTPLHEAARGLHTAIVKMLIDKKADRTKANRKNQLFLQLVGQQLMPAVETGDAEVIMQWLDWGVSPDTKGNLHWSILHHASARGQLNIVSLLIERGGDVNVEDSNRTTPLHTACFHGHLRIASLLIDSNANVNATDQRGNTPLHSAIEGSHPNVINLLLERGCDTTIANKEGQIFTHLVNEFLVTAVHANNISQVTSLLKGRADPNTRDAYGCPVLCHAAFKGDMLVAESLLEAGADPDLSDEAGKTPLHHAAYWGHLFVLKALLDKDATVNISDKNGSTPLHEAAREGVEDVITVLTGRGAKINATDDEGNTPLHAAGKWGQVTAVQLLIEKGAFDNIKNKNGLLYSDLALIRAVRTEEHTQVMSGLAWGGDPNSRDARGWTLLHHAVYKGAHDICLLLLECGANVNAADAHDRTPLLMAAYRGNHQIMQVLLDEGADINAQDWSGETPLHWAANEGSADTVQLLLEHGAHTNVKNKAGLLYSDLLLKHLYLAVRHKDADKVVKLVSAGANQFAEVEGIGLNPREEAKRQGLYDILRQMAALAKKDSQPEDDKIIALEDVYKLFEDGYITGDADSISSEEEEASEIEDAEESDNDEDAYWKMSNAYEVLTVKEAFQEDDDDWLSVWEEKPKVISAKELFEEDQAAFWEFWEEKPKAIPAKEFFKEESNWWEDDEDGNESKGGKADDSKILSAKEFFRDDECWWRDAVENFEKPRVISAKEFFSDEKPWWETDEEKEETKVLSAKEFFKDDNPPWWESEDKTEVLSAKEFFKDDTPPCWESEKTEVLSAKEFFKDDNQPWWETDEEALGHTNPGDEENKLRKKSPDVAHSVSYHSSFGEEESEYANSADVQDEEEGDNGNAVESSDGEADESNRADSFEDATDSVFSDSSNMYSASEGERPQASSVFRNTPWWEEVGKDGRDGDMLMSSEASQEEHWLDSMGEVSEGTETLDMDSSEISGMNAALEASQVATWLHDDMPCVPRVKRSKRSNIHRMKTEVDTDEDSLVKEERVKEKIEEEEDVGIGIRQNRLKKQGEENETSEDDAEGTGDKESSSDSEEIKSEDEMGDISDEELDAMELENEDEAAEDLTNVRDISPTISPVLCGNMDWDNSKICPGIMKGITPSVQVNMCETESDMIKFRTGDRREMKNHEQAMATPLDSNVDMVSKPDDLVKDQANIDIETTNTDSRLDPNQLSIYGHYMEGNLQKSDSQTSGYESSLSLSECAHQNKSSENKTSVVKKNRDRSVQERLADTGHNGRAKPLKTTADTGHNDGTKPLETTVDARHNDRTTTFEAKVDTGHHDRIKPLETTVDTGHNDRTKPLETTVDTGHNDRNETLETTIGTEHDNRTKPLETTVDTENNDRTKTETAIEKHSPEFENEGEPMSDIRLRQNCELETEVSIQDNSLERTKEIDVEVNSDQVSKGHSIIEQGNKRQDITEQLNKRKAGITQCEEKLVAKKQIDIPDIEQLGITKNENEQITENSISEETQDVIDHSSISKVMNERGSQNGALGNVTLHKTYAAAVKENIGEKTTMNKMDVCLAKVDASLAWVDARLTKDSNGRPGHRNSTENLGERARAESVRTRTLKEGGSIIAPEYLGRGKSLKSAGNDGSKILDKTKGEEDTVLLMKVHVHVPGEGSCVMVSEANSLTNQGGVSQSKLVVADSKIPGGTFLGVVNNGYPDLKTFSKYISQPTELTEVENVNTSSSRENDQNASMKMSVRTNVETEQDPIIENSPTDEEETSKDIKVETTQVIDLTEKPRYLSEDLENNEEAVEKKTLKMASGLQSNEDGNTTSEALSSNSKKDNHRGNEQPPDLRGQSLESDDTSPDEQERTSPEVADDSATGTRLDNKKGREQAKENSVERSLPKDRGEHSLPSPHKTIWRCSTYEAMSLSDYDNLAFLIRQTSSCPDCWSNNKRRDWSVSIESLDKAGDCTSETSADTSTSGQKQYHTSDPVTETLHDEGRTSRSSVERDDHRINVDEVSSSSGHSQVDKNNTETCEQSEGHLHVLNDRNSLVEDVQQVNSVLQASSMSLPSQPAQAEAQACTNCSENSSDPDPLPVPPRAKERKLPSQTVIQKVPGYSAESQSTNALKEPTNTALLYNPDKKDVGKVVAASQVWSDVPQARQGSAQTRSEVKLDKMKPNELVVMAGKTEPVRKSSSCLLS